MFWKCSEIIILLYCFSELVKHHLRMKVMCFDRKPWNYRWLGEIVSRMLFSRSRMNIELHNLVWQKKTSVQLLFPKLRNKNLVLVTKTITQIKSIFSHRSRGHNLFNWGVIYKWSVWEQLIRFELRLAFASGFVLHDYTVAHQTTTDDCTWHEPIHSDRREDHFHIFHKSNKKVL